METSSSTPLTVRQDNHSPVSPSHVELAPPMQGSAWAEMPEEELDLRRLIALIRRRSLIIAGVAIAVVSFIIGYTLLQEPIYGGRFRLLVEPVNDPNNNLSGLTNNTNQSPRESELDYETQIQVLRNPELIIAMVDKLQSTYPTLTPLSVLENLTIQQLQETKILEIGYESANAAEVEAVLKQLSEDYLEYSLKERQSNLRQGIQFIESQLPATQDRVDQLQKELQTFRQQNNFIDQGTQSSLILNQASQLAGQRLVLDQNIAQARATLESLQGDTGALAALTNAPIYQQLINQLRQVESEIARERTRFQDDSLAIRVLQEQRENLLPLLQEEARRVVGERVAQVATQIQTLEVERQAIAQSQARLDQKVQDLPFLIRRYTDLERELLVATNSLTRFLATREALQIEASQREIPWQIVEAPFQFLTPVSPNIRRSVILGILASLLLGFVTAVIVDKLDDVYHNVEDLKSKIKLPLLGIIPFQRQIEEFEDSLIQERKPLNRLEELIESISQEQPEQQAVASSINRSSSRFLASFQVLATKIQLLKPDRPVRSVVVSSALVGDGKSTIALYLSQTAAEMGQRVLLVDADLRQAQLQTRLNLNNLKGLSNLIAQHLPLHEVIYQPFQTPGFFLLPAGDIPPNPISLLSSHRMHQLMSELTRVFDLVIYDTPAMDGLADTSLVAPYTDGILLVIRLSKTERFAISQTLDNLKMSQMPVLGMIANGIK